MAEYIEREALRKEIQTAQEKLESDNDIVWEMNQKYFAGLAWAHRLVIDAPAADVAPVVRGRWVYDHWCEFKCSECGEFSNSKPYKGRERYCPNCGAHMKDGE